MKNITKEILEGGGEGIVLRECHSLYIGGRSHSLFKIKAKRDDDAKLVTINEDGSYTCQLSDNRLIVAELVEPALKEFLRPGDIISFQFQKVTGDGKPIRPYIIRNDFTWEDILVEKGNRKRTLADIVKGKKVFPNKNNNSLARPHGFWTRDEGSNMRIFLDNFAKKRNMDPLNPNDWYKVKFNDLISAGGMGLLRHFGYSHIDALVSIYNDIGLKKEMFLGYNGWLRDAGKRREFFDNFAKSKEFDPLNAESWYAFSKKHFSMQGGKSLLKFYRGSHIIALKDVYPDLQWDKLKFADFSEHVEEELKDPEIKPHGFWKETKNLTKLCRLLEQKFNIGTNLEQWYSVSINGIKDEGYRYKHVIMSCGGLAGFLKRVYPDHKWIQWKFPAVRPGYWKEEENLRGFVRDIEKELSISCEYAFPVCNYSLTLIDILKREEWYSVTRLDIKKLGGEHILKESGGLAPLLRKIYPGQEWQEWKWAIAPRGFWDELDNIKRFFDFVYRELKLSSMHDWHSVTQQQIVRLGGKRLLLITKGGSTLPTLLRKVYPDHPWKFESPSDRKLNGEKGILT